MKKRRNEKDPLKILENLAKEYNLASHQELEEMEIESHVYVAASVTEAESQPECKAEQLLNDVYWNNDKHYIRGKLYEESQIPAGQKY